MFIYLITNLTNGKQYVGQTIQDPVERWKRHNWNHNFLTDIKKAIRKYGKENFKFEVIDTANSMDELNAKETAWIAKLNTFNKGYNRNKGGGNRQMSGDTKDKISNKLKGIKRPHFNKKVICVNTGEEFDSQTEACKHFGLRKGHIAESIRKNFKIRKELIFRYKEI